MKQSQQTENLPNKKEFLVPSALARSRVDVALASLAGCTRSHAQTLIKARQVLCNGETVQTAKVKIQEGDRLTFFEAPLTTLIATPLPLEILYEDDVLMVINKPAGLVVHPAPGHSCDTLVNALIALRDTKGTTLEEEENSSSSQFLRPGIVHRLDKDTTGLIVVAKTSAAHEALTRQFRPFDEAGELSKIAGRTYLGLVYGRPEPFRGRIQNTLGRHRINRQRWAVSPQGKLAITEYETLKSWPSFRAENGLNGLKPRRSARTQSFWISLVRFHLLTGRTHQIRVHCEHAGFPLVGDPVYTNHAPHKSAWPESIANFPRQALHAATLRLTHPQTQKEMTFECSLPEDMTAIIQELEKL